MRTSSAPRLINIKRSAKPSKVRPVDDLILRLKTSKTRNKRANKPFHVRTGHDYLFSLTSRGTQLVNKLVAQIVTRAGTRLGPRGPNEPDPRSRRTRTRLWVWLWLTSFEKCTYKGK